MIPVPAQPHPAIVGDRVELQLFATLTCNLRCTYCSAAVGDVLGSQGHVSYGIGELEAFVRDQLSGKQVYVTFYGGEPTLNAGFIASVMERFPHFRYQLQTNGTLLHRLPEDICARLDHVLVSVDGGEQTTDGYRGRGVFRRVMRNLDKVRARIPGTVTARVTWSSPETSFEELDGLLGAFDYLYFQFAQRHDGYGGQDMVRRKAVIDRLVERFFAGPGLYPVVPLMGIVRNKVMTPLADERCAGLSHCRVCTHIINVLPDGRVFPCPDLTYLPEMQQGSVTENWLRRSPLQPHPAMPCENCEAHGFCRGNCMKNLYVGYVQGDAAYRSQVVEPVCELVRYLGRAVERFEPSAWFDAADGPVREEVAQCKVYDYVEVMP